EPRFGGVFCFLLPSAISYFSDLADKKSSLCLRIRVRKTLNSSLWLMQFPRILCDNNRVDAHSISYVRLRAS
ncbi:TPA: hypothetical protein ACXEQR_004440, partial [Klebsiella pneumoniae]